MSRGSFRRRCSRDRASFRQSGVGLCLGKGPKMCLGKAAEPLGAMAACDLAGGGPYRGRGSLGKSHPGFFPKKSEPPKELRACQEGGRGYRDIGFRSRPLLHLEGESLPFDRPVEDEALGELIDQRARTGGDFARDFGEGRCMSPGKEAVEVAEPLVELIVLGWPQNDESAASAHCLPDLFGQPDRPRIAGDLLAVPHPETAKNRGGLGIHKDSRDDQRSEEISFSTLVRTRMGRVALRVPGLLVSDPRFAQDFRFKEHLDEIRGSGPLDEDLAAPVGTDNHRRPAPVEKPMGEDPQFKSLFPQALFQFRNLVA